jgi:pantoate--beta-alanine ligase
MQMITTAAAWRAAMQADDGDRVGLVPTMGALHAGHVSLMTQARAECDAVAVSIFVNPLQFGEAEDLAKYPRTLEQDLEACAEAGVDIVFAPPVSEMYPGWPVPVATTVSVSGLSAGWEGASRIGHFDGVATVVAKLFSLAGPCRAYFGEKDFQQLAVVRRMSADLSLPVEVVGCPTIREADGLALSSRNVRLSDAERRAAVVLPRALSAGQAAMADGIRSGVELSVVMRGVVATEPLVELDYAVAVDATTLLESAEVTDPASTRLLIAAKVGPVRLIDNAPAVPVATRREARQLERIG